MLLADKSLWDGQVGNAYVLGWKSTMIKRLCRSTMAAETQAMLSSVAHCMKLRACIADMLGHLKWGDWMESSRSTVRLLWLTDCESLHSYLCNPIPAGNEDARLELDLEDLRQILWEDVNGNPQESLQEDDYNKVRWIDTSTMIADPLTKGMNPSQMLEFLKTGVIDLEPTAEAKTVKAMKQKQRQKAREQKNLAKDLENDQEQVNRDAVTEFYIGE